MYVKIKYKFDLVTVQVFGRRKILSHPKNVWQLLSWNETAFDHNEIWLHKLYDCICFVSLGENSFENCCRIQFTDQINNQT